MKRLLFAFAFMLIAAPAFAQTFDTVQLTFYAAASPTTPSTTFDFPIAAAVCNQPQPAVVPPVNPRRVVWDDPNNAGRACIWTDTPGGPLLGLPVGSSWELTARWKNATGVGVESNRAPFTRALLAPSGAPTGVRLTP